MHTIYQSLHKWLFALSLFTGLIANAQTETAVLKISGKVLTTGSQKPISGVSISVPQYSSVITNDSGLFTISVPSLTSTLLVSGGGFQNKEVALKNRKDVVIQLSDESQKSIYDQVQLPFGKLPAIQSVHAQGAIDFQKDNWRKSSETPERNIQGQVAGLNVINRSGTPGIGADLFLRGYTSLYATNAPLIVVDGVIFDNNDYGSTIASGAHANPLASIDPKDIDQITVVKDAVSLYGSKAANGVIFISTSRSKEQATRINFNVSSGVNVAPKQYPVLNASEYRTYLAELLQSKGLSDAEIQSLPYISNNKSNSDYYQYANSTKWQNQVLKNSTSQNYYLKITGGDETATYGLSLGYIDQKGVIRQTDYSRYNVRFNGDIDMGARFHVSTNLALSYGENKLSFQGINPKLNPLYVSLIKAPFLSVNEIDNSGYVSPNVANTDVFSVSNPAALINSAYSNNKSYQFNGNLNFTYDLTRSIKVSSIFGTTIDKVRESEFVPRYGVTSDTTSKDVVFSRMGSNIDRFSSVFNDTRISYSGAFDYKQKVSLIAGSRYLTSSSEIDYGLGYNSATDDLHSIGTGTTALRETGGQIGKWNWLNSYLGLNYSLSNTYFLSANVSADGSSRFGKEISDALTINGNKYGVFPSVGAAWLVSSEPFMADVNSIEFLKLRASYGITGNDDIGNYNAKQLYVPQNLYTLQGLTRSNISNPKLQWETQKTTNVGVDLGLFNERVNLSFDVYKKHTSNLIVYEPQSVYVGIDDIITNNGSIENKGWELEVNNRLIDNAVKWNVGFSIAHNTSKVLSLPATVDVTYADATLRSEVGGAPAVFYGYQTTGVFASDAQAQASGLKNKLSNGSLIDFRGGDMHFVDLNGDKIIDENDRTNLGNAAPTYFGAINTSVEWKNISLSAIFSYSYGNKIYNYTRAQLESMSGYNNQTPAVLNRWKTDGQITNTPRAEWGDPQGNARFSDRWVEDGSYLKLQNLTLSYTLPFKVSAIRSVSLYASAYNVFTITKYLGYSPEFSASGSVYAQGVDVGLFPQYQSVLFGVNLGL